MDGEILRARKPTYTLTDGGADASKIGWGLVSKNKFHDPNTKVSEKLEHSLQVSLALPVPPPPSPSTGNSPRRRYRGPVQEMLLNEVTNKIDMWRCLMLPAPNGGAVGKRAAPCGRGEWRQETCWLGGSKADQSTRCPRRVFWVHLHLKDREYETPTTNYSSEKKPHTDGARLIRNKIILSGSGFDSFCEEGGG